jgi:hypothetical protein
MENSSTKETIIIKETYTSRNMINVSKVQLSRMVGTPLSKVSAEDLTQRLEKYIIYKTSEVIWIKFGR